MGTKDPAGDTRSVETARQKGNTEREQRRPASRRFAHGDDARGRRSSVRPDLNFTALAEELGVTPSSVSTLVKGVGTPSVPFAEKLARAMDITLAQLLKELGEQKLRRKSKAL